MENLPGKLPYEIWLKIFYYLSTFDILNFCDAFEEVSYFLKDKDVVREFNLNAHFKFYNVDVYKYITQNVGYEHIKLLNINKLYWIPLDDLRKLIKLLPRLEGLCAVDTRLSIREKDVKLYGKLKKLGISAEARHFTADPSLYSNNMYLLKKFCLKVVLKKPNFQEIYSLFGKLVGLEELWINDADDSVAQPIKYDCVVYHLKFLKRLVIKSKLNIPFLDYKPFGLAKVFECRRFKSIAMCYVKCPADRIVPIKDVSIFEPFETEVEEAWDVLHKFRCEMPWDAGASEIIYMTKQIRRVEFDELNFYHNRCFCNPSFTKATLDILRSDNSRKLRRLNVRSCVLQRKPPSKNRTLQRLEGNYPFEEVADNCANLKELELMACSNCNVTILGAYPLVSRFVNLEKFTLEVPAHLDGKFLNEVLRNCVKLGTLKVISQGTNENLNVNLCAALRHATSLRDFSFENKHVNMDRLFAGLGRTGRRQLQRIFVKCRHAGSGFETSSLKALLEANDQIVFLYLAILDNTARENARIQEVLNAFKKDSPAKIYFARKDDVRYYGNFPIPEAHKDVMHRDTHVSAIDFAEFA